MYVSLWRRAALVLACFGMMVPQGAFAAEKTQQYQTVQTLDVKLANGGTLSGQVVDAQGKTVSNAVVSVRFGNRVVASTKTNASGRYAIQGLRAGVHQIQTANGRVNARFWSGTTAPVAAKSTALLVSDKNIIRAQCGNQCCNQCDPCCDDGSDMHGMLMSGLVIAGVVTAIAIAADDDDDDPSSP